MIRALMACFIWVMISGPVLSEPVDYFFLTDVGTSAHSVRLGNIEGHSGLAAGVFENPASIYKTYRLSTSLFQTQLMDEVTYRSLAATFRLPLGVLGVGVMSTRVDELFETAKDLDRNKIIKVGTFDYSNYIAKAAYQLSFSQFFHVGVAGSMFYQDYSTVSSVGYNLDTGFYVDDERLDISFVMKNVLTSFDAVYSDTDKSETSSDGKTENLPFQTITSLKYNLGRIDLYGQIKTSGSNNFLRYVGVNYQPALVPFFSISGGMKERPLVSYEIDQKLEKIERVMSLGLGLELWGVSFDYAYEASKHIMFKHNHFFSLGLSL